MNDCPNRPNGVHSFTYSVGAGMKNEYEPTQYGQSASDTLYKCIPYSYLACSCGAVTKQKIRVDD